jgi:hypothetical protein
MKLVHTPTLLEAVEDVARAINRVITNVRHWAPISVELLLRKTMLAARSGAGQRR